MVDVAKVKIFGMDMGTFRWDEAYGVARFEYDRDFIATGLEPSPIMMPVQQGRVYSFGSLNRDTFNGLPGMLADSLPDDLLGPMRNDVFFMCWACLWWLLD